MGADWNAIVAGVGVGVIAGLFLDIVLFLLVVTTPTLLVLSLLVALSSSLTAWIIPATWIAQQAAYLLTLHLARRRSYDRVIERVRVMMRL